MSLSPAEQEVWYECELDLASSSATLPVDRPVENIAQLLEAIQYAGQSSQISEETYERAHGFLLDIVEHGNSDIFGELQYYEGFSGLNLVLGFRLGEFDG